MDKDRWIEVDHYFEGLMLPRDEVLEKALEASAAAGLPAINVSPNQGRFLNLLARMLGARKILEIGTLGGYSSIWLARALPPDGRLITLEYEPRHADVARANLERAGLADRVEIRVGRAIETLPELEPEAPFDLVFIDADKPSTADYVEWAVRLGRPGTAIVVDNVVRDGAVVDEHSSDQNVQGVRRANELVGKHPKLAATAIQTVGVKGYDGFVLALVEA
jgi:predicted O-methyltransferase YrrM